MPRKKAGNGLKLNFIAKNKLMKSKCRKVTKNRGYI